MLYKDIKQCKQLTVFNSLIKYNIVHWHTGGDGQIDRIGIRNYHPGQNITWVKIEYVHFVDPTGGLQKQDPNVIFKCRK